MRRLFLKLRYCTIPVRLFEPRKFPPIRNMGYFTRQCQYFLKYGYSLWDGPQHTRMYAEKAKRLFFFEPLIVFAIILILAAIAIHVLGHAATSGYVRLGGLG